jgi:hypothetical protein
MNRLFDKALENARAKRNARAFERAWERARNESASATHRAEIDAIFSQRLG